MTPREMATLSQAKTLGGIGSILIFIPFISLVGWILVLIAVKQISDDLQDRGIFNNILIAAVTGVVGALAGAFVLVVGVIGAGSAANVTSALFSVGLGLLIAWIALIISAVFLRRAYDSISRELQVGTFKTAATLYLVGAVLTIVLVGLLVLLIAEIIQAVAFFSIPDRTAAGVPPAPPAMPGQAQAAPPPPPGGESKFCTSCGTRISPSATFCYSCGAKQ